MAGPTDSMRAAGSTALRSWTRWSGVQRFILLAFAWLAVVGLVYGWRGGDLMLAGVVGLSLLFVGGLFGLIGWWLIAKRTRGALDLETDLLAREAQAELKRTWAEAVERFRRAGARPDQVPFFVFVGEPQSGKTTTLNRALKSAAGGPQKVGGISGTKNCDWFFSDDGIVLDTAGRLIFHGRRTGEQSEIATKVDEEEWRRFLALLNQHKPECPINGAIIAIPCTSLLQDSSEERAEKARVILGALRDLQGSLEIRFPVFVLFTKADVIPGFREYCLQPDVGSTRQMFGWSRPEGTREQPLTSEEVDVAYGNLVHRLRRWRLRLLRGGGIGEAQARALFGFPEEVQALQSAARDYLAQIFGSREMIYESLFLRGFWFTSGKQEGSPISNLARAFMPRGMDDAETPAWLSAAEATNPVFLHDLYERKVFRETGLVVPTRLRRDRVRRVLRWTVAMGLIVALGTLGWTGYRLFVNDPEPLIQALGAVDEATAEDSDGKSETWLRPLEGLGSLRRADGTTDRHGTIVDLTSGTLLSGELERGKLTRATARAHRAVVLRRLVRPALERLGELLREQTMALPKPHTDASFRLDAFVDRVDDFVTTVAGHAGAHHRFGELLRELKPELALNDEQCRVLGLQAWLVERGRTRDAEWAGWSDAAYRFDEARIETLLRGAGSLVHAWWSLSGGQRPAAEDRSVLAKLRRHARIIDAGQRIDAALGELEVLESRIPGEIGRRVPLADLITAWQTHSEALGEAVRDFTEHGGEWPGQGSGGRPIDPLDSLEGPFLEEFQRSLRPHERDHAWSSRLMEVREVLVEDLRQLKASRTRVNGPFDAQRGGVRARWVECRSLEREGAEPLELYGATPELAARTTEVSRLAKLLLATCVEGGGELSKVVSAVEAKTAIQSPQRWQDYLRKLRRGLPSWDFASERDGTLGAIEEAAQAVFAGRVLVEVVLPALPIESAPRFDHPLGPPGIPRHLHPNQLEEFFATTRAFDREVAGLEDLITPPWPVAEPSHLILFRAALRDTMRQSASYWRGPESSFGTVWRQDVDRLLGDWQRLREDIEAERSLDNLRASAGRERAAALRGRALVAFENLFGAEAVATGAQSAQARQTAILTALTLWLRGLAAYPWELYPADAPIEARVAAAITWPEGGQLKAVASVIDRGVQRFRAQLLGRPTGAEQSWSDSASKLLESIISRDRSKRIPAAQLAAARRAQLPILSELRRIESGLLSLVEDLDAFAAIETLAQEDLAAELALQTAWQALLDSPAAETWPYSIKSETPAAAEQVADMTQRIAAVQAALERSTLARQALTDSDLVGSAPDQPTGAFWTAPHQAAWQRLIHLDLLLQSQVALSVSVAWGGHGENQDHPLAQYVTWLRFESLGQNRTQDRKLYVGSGEFVTCGEVELSALNDLRVAGIGTQRRAFELRSADLLVERRFAFLRLLQLPRTTYDPQRAELEVLFEMSGVPHELDGSTRVADSMLLKFRFQPTAGGELDRAFAPGVEALIAQKLAGTGLQELERPGG